MNLTLCTFESGGQPFFNVTTSVKYTLSYTRIARTLTVGTPILQRLVRVWICAASWAGVMSSVKL